MHHAVLISQRRYVVAVSEPAVEQMLRPLREELGVSDATHPRDHREAPQGPHEMLPRVRVVRLLLRADHEANLSDICLNNSQRAASSNPNASMNEVFSFIATEKPWPPSSVMCRDTVISWMTRSITTALTEIRCCRVSEFPT